MTRHPIGTLADSTASNRSSAMNITQSYGAEQIQTAVWNGSPACGNERRLVGSWYPAIDAGAVSPTRCTTTLGARSSGTHDELWAMDHEGLPVTDECSSQTATTGALLI